MADSLRLSAALFLGAVDLDVGVVLAEVLGVVVWASMPGALGESARVLPTFLVPATGVVLVVEEVEVAEVVEAGVVCAYDVAEPPSSKVTNRRSVFIGS